MSKILVALDGSPRAGHVLATAIELAKKSDAKLVLFRAFGLPAAMPEQVWALPSGSLIDTLRDDAEKYLDGCAKQVPPELLAGTRVSIGAPWQAICDAANVEKADLVVIGSHGYGGLDHLLGTTAAKVVNHASQSVLVVRGSN